ncbi:MAG: S8 family serine peptidase [Candidatus Zixiibacteriota bacterium]
MNYIRSLLVAALMALLLLTDAHAQDFYYSLGSVENLIANDDFVSIRFVNENRTDPYSFAVQTSLLTDDFIPFPISPDFWCFRLESNLVGSAIADSLTELPDIEVAHPSYYSKDSLHVFLTDRLVIRFRAGISPGFVDSLFDSNGLALDTTEIPRQDVFVVNKTGALSGEPIELANALYNVEGVEYCHPDFVVEVVKFGYPTDEFFAYQWNFHNTGQTLGTPDADIDAPEAWDITLGDSSVVVAVIDDGIQFLSPYLHPDIDYLKVLPGYDFGGDDTKFQASPDDNPSPCSLNTHGMSCTGLIAGSMNNGEGMSGLAPNVRILPVKIFRGYPESDYCTGLPLVYLSRIASGIEWAIANGAQILTCSWGCPVNDDVAWSLSVAYSAGIGTFVAAGNEYRNFPSAVSFPASLPSVMAVGATDQWDRIWNYSNKGDSIDVVAPSGGLGGGNLFSLDGVSATGYVPELYQCAPSMLNNYMCGFGGTSGACPQVAGIAALILSIRPDLRRGGVETVQELYRLIKSSAEDELGDPLDVAGWDRYYGWGRVNAKAALDSAQAGPIICSWIVGDADGSGVITISDAVHLINYIFAGGDLPRPHNPGSGDPDCTGIVTISDAVFIINYIFAGGPEPWLTCESYF